MGSVMVLAMVVMGQDGMEDMTDMDSMLAAPSGGDGGGGGAHKKEKELTVIQQTTLALQQLGIVIGLSLIHSLLFYDFVESSMKTLLFLLLLSLFNLFPFTMYGKWLFFLLACFTPILVEFQAQYLFLLF